jgi:hypothetical protein
MMKKKIILWSIAFIVLVSLIGIISFVNQVKQETKERVLHMLDQTAYAQKLGLRSNDDNIGDLRTTIVNNPGAVKAIEFEEQAPIGKAKMEGGIVTFIPGRDTNTILENLNNFILYREFDLEAFNEEYLDDPEQYLHHPLIIDDIINRADTVNLLIKRDGVMKITNIEIELTFSNRPFDWTKAKKNEE